ncbi:deoxyguanosinetriphosphate triphosphohydrolase family protein [Shewanella avicenniae]|uniref:Deoxyguanosinetriphosphate triphosphohydrolase-like protein n=1 Tax=Shewanella avicenniae TaxID=2814294 RepID=A0ABX7QX64_9GAMM|nr:anti-phage deoxyguanosine triphosphatase [Shewanella avicenniae]QSX35228.1 deoxyguanosinetriphosphate triphosphohydrolase family protein [Shewanella avicenniae]
MEFWQQRQLQDQSSRRQDLRSPYQRDRARIMHSAAFRRLQAKTQVLGVGMNDFYRTRLTHSLEVAQIGTGIANQLQQHPNAQVDLLDSMSLVEALCFAHDIGHPPFGHGGETALNYMMRDHGGFEGNGQTLRILAKLEPYTEHYGMNLTRRTLLGIIKYPALTSSLANYAPQPKLESFRQLKPEHWPAVKGIFDDDADVFDWVLAPFSDRDKQLFTQVTESSSTGHYRSQHKSFDCTVMELADDIAYAVHDMEDAIVMGIVDRSHWRQFVTPRALALPPSWITEQLAAIEEKLFSHKHYLRKDAIGTLVNAFVTAVVWEQYDQFESPLLRYRATMAAEYGQLLDIFKQFVLRYVIQKPEVQILEYKGQQIVMELFDALTSDPQRLLPSNTRERWLAAAEKHQGERVIADYISGMTDEFAARLHQQLFSARSISMMEFGGQ